MPQGASISMHPNIIFPGTWDFFRPFLEACLYVGTPPTFKVVPRSRYGQRQRQQTSADRLGKHLCAVSLAPCLPLVGWGAT